MKSRLSGKEVSSLKKSSGGRPVRRRASNGAINLLMPSDVVRKYRAKYSKGGKIIHRRELADESDYTIIQRYQSVLQGLYNYYCMAANVYKRMSHVKWILQVSAPENLGEQVQEIGEADRQDVPCP